MPLWPHGAPEPAQVRKPEKDVQADKGAVPGRPHNVQLTNVTVPTLTMYPPPPGVPNTGAAALVFPAAAIIFSTCATPAPSPASGSAHDHATGGHAFGVHPSPSLPQEHWLDLALNWLRFSQIIPAAVAPP